jgi:bifunctional non-homologous end joining protein LigD
MPKRSFGRYSFETSNEDKVLFPGAGITKGDLIDYYRKIAKSMLPHVERRPLTMQRFPDGIEAGGFYEKQAPDHFPGWIERVTVRTADGSQEQVTCNKAAALAYLGQQACITPHVWLSRADRLDRPDRVVFDLDPPDGHDFDVVRQAALTFKSLFDEAGLTAFVKTTGSRGLHVVLPLTPEAGFDDVREWAHRLAEHLAGLHPDTLTTQIRKNKRKGRLYLDTGRNAYGQTAVAPYAVRARPDAPVATPLTWDEVESGEVHARSYTLGNILRRIGRRGDVWSGMARHRRTLRSLEKAIGP